VNKPISEWRTPTPDLCIHDQGLALTKASLKTPYL